MKEVFEKAKVIIDGDVSYLCIALPYIVAKKFISGMKQRKYVLEIKEYRKKRSLDSNAYCWVLCGKLAAKISTPGVAFSPDDVYRAAIRDVGDNYEIIPVRAQAIDAFDKAWCADHIGRFTEDLGPCRNTAGYHNIRVFYGSSDYDTKTMSRLLDILVQDCKEHGIETLSDRELSLLKEEWNA